MDLVQQHTVNDSTVLISYQNSSELTCPKMAHTRNDPRLDSAICMPSAKKSTVYAPRYHKNESLEGWVDGLLKELDNVMSTTLNFDPKQNNSQRVQEVN